jgi:predicted RNase H-like HicB family nuclease
MLEQSKYIVLIHKNDDGSYWGECPELPGCFSQGGTTDELLEHMREAIALYLKDSPDIIINRIEEVRELAV